jgi:hypothetical protein
LATAKLSALICLCSKNFYGSTLFPYNASIWDSSTRGAEPK